MIFVNLLGGDYGIGVVGGSLTNALSAIAEVRRLDDTTRNGAPLPGPLLERFNQYQPTIQATRHVAYAVFERDLQMRRADMTRCGYDFLAAACRWCEEVIRETGFQAVTTIHHGVDGTCFSPSHATRTRFNNRFVVFSGGKFELRKAQDVVIRAFKVFAERHADAFLVAAWHNLTYIHASTMEASPHVHFSLHGELRIEDAIRRCLVNAGVDLNRVELVPQLPHAMLADIYGNSDVGLFPNRCEGATNLVMMEYMACGRPAIATNFSGHLDILTSANSFRLRHWKPFPVRESGRPVACWCEPSLDEVIEQLETAYHNRDLLTQVGRRAAEDMSEWTWQRAARQFLQLLEAA